MSLPRLCRTWSAVVGESSVKRLALGAASGTPAAPMRASAIGWAGMRRPTVGRPAVTMAGIVHDEDDGAAELLHPVKPTPGLTGAPVCSAGRKNASAPTWDLGRTSVNGPGQNRRARRSAISGQFATRDCAISIEAT